MELYPAAIRARRPAVPKAKRFSNNLLNFA